MKNFSPFSSISKLIVLLKCVSYFWRTLHTRARAHTYNTHECARKHSPSHKRMRTVTHLHNIMHETITEHPIQFELLIFQDVLKASFRTILCQQTRVWLFQAGPQEAYQVVMVKISHLWKPIILNIKSIICVTDCWLLLYQNTWHWHN